MTHQKIKTFLWYDCAAEQAAEYYCTLFKNSCIHRVSRYPEGGMGPAGSVMTVEFSLSGVDFVALNGGPMFQFNEAISLTVDCEDQAEVDFLWDKLIVDGGSPSMCGWLKDRWGLSWQIVPSVLPKLMSDRSGRVMQAMMQMTKLEIQKLQDAYDGKGSTTEPSSH